MSERTPDYWTTEYEGRLIALRQIVLAAGDVTLQYFCTDRFNIERKSDSSPVTEADRSAEELVRRQVAEKYPLDSILGEEFGAADSTSAYRWIVDPIDGTKSFICGVPLYSTLLGLEHEGQMVAGAILIPALHEIAIAAKGMGAWFRRDVGTWKRCRVSRQTSLSDAVFVTSQIDSFDGVTTPDVYRSLEKECSITRTWGDAYGYLLIATGRADLMVDPVVKPWDVGAILPVIEEAGGKFSDWSGKSSIYLPNAVGTNGLLHNEVLRRLNPSK